MTTRNILFIITLLIVSSFFFFGQTPETDTTVQVYIKDDTKSLPVYAEMTHLDNVTAKDIPLGDSRVILTEPKKKTNGPAKVSIDKTPRHGITTEVINVENLDVTQATVQLKKTGEVREINYCNDWNEKAYRCNEWTYANIPFTDKGTYVEFTVEHFTAYGGDDAGWWNTSWNKKAPIDIEYSNFDGVTNESVPIIINTSTLITDEKMQNNCVDARFLNDNQDEGGILTYELENSTCNTNETVFWVLMDVLDPDDNNTVWFYYNSSDAADVSDPTATSKTGTTFLTYHFGENTTNANATFDSSDQYNNASANGTIEWTADGRFGGAYDFEEGYLNLEKSARTGNENFTMSGWFKTSADASENSSQIWHSEDAGSNGESTEVLLRNNHTFFYVRDDSGIAVEVEGSKVVNDGDWHHFYAGYNGTTYALFVDGELDNEVHNGTVKNTFNTAVTPRIGSMLNDPATPRNFNGSIDDIRIFGPGVGALFANHTSLTPIKRFEYDEYSDNIPTVNGVGLHPTSPNFTQNIYGYGNYSDVDGNQEKHSTYKFFRNGKVAQSETLAVVFHTHFDGDNITIDNETAAEGNYVIDTSGKYNSAINITGTDTSVNLTYDSQGNINISKGTIEFWIKPQYNGDDNNSYNYFTVEGTGDELMTVSKLVAGGVNYVSFAIATDDETVRRSVISVDSNNFTDGTWHYVAATWNETGNLSIYLNEDIGVYTPQSNGSGTMPGVASQFVIGNEAVEADPAPANASFDEFRIHGRALNVTELLDNYNKGREFYKQEIMLHTEHYNESDEVVFEYCPSDGTNTGTCKNSSTVTVQGRLLNSCDVLSASGTYTLSQDITFSSHDFCFNITSAGVTLDCADYAITGNQSNHGVLIDNSLDSQTTISHCKILNVTTGIEINISNSVRFNASEIGNASAGIKIWESNNSDVLDNYIVNTTKAIELHGIGTTNNTFTRNAVNFSDESLFLSQIDGLSATLNTFSNNAFVKAENQLAINIEIGGSDVLNQDFDDLNRINELPFIFNYSLETLTLEGNNDKVAEIILGAATNVTVTNYLIENGGYGVYFWNSADSVVENVTLINSSFALFSESSNNISFKNISIHSPQASNNFSIELSQSINNSFTNITLVNSSVGGIKLDRSDHTNINNTNFINISSQGVMLDGGTGNQLYNNYFEKVGTDGSAGVEVGAVGSFANDNTTLVNNTFFDFEFDNGKRDGIVVYGNSTSIINNTFENVDSGVRTSAEIMNLLIDSNHISDTTGNAIYIGRTANATVINNKITFTTDTTSAIMGDFFVINATITYNIINNTQRGINLSNVQDSIVSNNTIFNITEFGIGVDHNNNLTINNNTVYNFSSIGSTAGIVGNFTNSLIHDNTVFSAIAKSNDFCMLVGDVDASFEGINSTESLVYNNTAYDCATCFAVFSMGTNLTNNTAYDCSTIGIDATTSANYLLESNTIYQTTQDGIAIGGASNFKLYNNTVFNTTQHGISFSLRTAIDGEVIGNQLYNNSITGISLFNTTGVNVTKNNITGNQYVGVELLDNVTESYVWQNNIYNNYEGTGKNIQVNSTSIDTGNALSFDLYINKQGNYWGRSDAPFFVNGTSSDSDSNDPTVNDSYPYNKAYDSWLWPSGDNTQTPTVEGIALHPGIPVTVENIYGYGNYSDVQTDYENGSTYKFFRNEEIIQSGDLSVLFHAHFDNSNQTVDGENVTEGIASFDSAGKFGQAVNLTGEDASVNLTYETASNFNFTDGTVEFWIKPFYDGNNGLSHKYFEAYGTGQEVLSIEKDEADNLTFSIETDDETVRQVHIAVDTTNFADSEWHYIAATWNNSGNMTLVLDDTVGAYANVNNGTGTLSGTQQHFIIGNTNAASEAEPANASIDEVRIHNRALNYSELFDNYNKNRPYYNQEVMLHTEHYNVSDNITFEYCPHDGVYKGECQNSSTLQVKAIPVINQYDLINSTEYLQVNSSVYVFLNITDEDSNTATTNYTLVALNNGTAVINNTNATWSNAELWNTTSFTLDSFTTWEWIVNVSDDDGLTSQVNGTFTLLSVNISLDPTTQTAFTNLTAIGEIALTNGSIAENVDTVYLWRNGTLISNTTTDANGFYNQTFNITAAGDYLIKTNATFLGHYAESEAPITITSNDPIIHSVDIIDETDYLKVNTTFFAYVNATDPTNDIMTVNFTLVALNNGTAVINNTNATTNAGDFWNTSSYTLDSHTTWEWIVSATDEQGNTAQDNGTIILAVLNATLDPSPVGEQENISLTGEFSLSNGSKAENINTVYLWRNGTFITSITTDSDGAYNHTFNITNHGQYNVTVNGTFDDSYAETEQTITVTESAPTINTVDSINSSAYLQVNSSVYMFLNITDEDNNTATTNYTLVALNNGTAVINNTNATWSNAESWNTTSFTLDSFTTWEWIVNVSDDKSNTAQANGTFELLLINLSLNQSTIGTYQELNVSGEVALTNGSIAESISTVYVWQNGSAEGTPTTESNGKYADVFNVLNDTGSFEIKVNSTFLGYYGEANESVSIISINPPTMNEYVFINDTNYMTVNTTFFVHANVSDDNNLATVNYTLVAGNGTAVINNTNATWSNAHLYNTSSYTLDDYGVWEWIVNATDDNGDTAQINGTIVLMNANISLDPSSVNVSENTTVFGNIALGNGSLLENVNTVYIWLNGEEQGSTTTDADGFYNKTIAAINTTGSYTVKTNATFDGKYGENSATLTIGDVTAPTTTDNSTTGIEWFSSEVNISLNATDTDAINYTAHCIYNFTQPRCTAFTSQNVTADGLSYVNVTCAENNACQYVIAYFSEDNSGNNNSASALYSNTIYLVRGSSINNMSNLSYTFVHNASHIDNSTITNSTIDNSTVIDGILLNSTTTKSGAINVTVTNSTTSTCYVDGSHVFNSELTTSDLYETACELYNSSIDLSVVTSSTIYNASLLSVNSTNSLILDADLQHMNVFGADIEGDVLISGRVKYQGTTYFAPYNISLIYANTSPYVVGTVRTNETYTHNGSLIMLTYTAGEIGYTAQANVSLVNTSTALLDLNDTGEGLDDTVGDGIHQLYDALRISGDEGEQQILVHVRDNIGNNWTVNTSLIIDNTAPNGSINITSSPPLGFEQADNDVTNSRTVILQLNYSDEYGVAFCRYANEDLAYTSEEDCVSTKSWLLSDGVGNKTVFFNLTDNAGNTKVYNDTIFLNTTGGDLDTTAPDGLYVEDDGVYIGDNTSLAVRWYNATDKESNLLAIPLTYEYAVGTSAGAVDVVNYTAVGTVANATINDLDLSHGTTYYVSIKAINSAGLNYTASTNGITVDTVNPGVPSVTSSHDSTLWINNNTLTVNWSATDADSDIDAYSYVLDQSSSTTPDTVPEYDTSKTYNNLGDGTFYFHIRARDNASNWGSTTSVTVQIDTSAPSIPQLLNPTSVSNQSWLIFNWTRSADISGINDYYLQVGTSAGGSDTFDGSVGNVTGYNVSGLSAGTTYYARVRALNNASIYSSYSDSVSSIVDTGAPGILHKSPAGTVISSEVILSVKTDEEATCQYRSSPLLSYSDFTYTGKKHHETRIFKGDATYGYGIQCYDTVGNVNTSSINFTVSTSTTPGSISLVDNTSLIIGKKSSYVLNITSGGTGLSGVHRHMTKVGLVKNGDDHPIDAFSLFDLGSGAYNLTFTSPKISGTYQLNVTLGSKELVTPVTYGGLSLNITYQASSLNQEIGSKTVASRESDHLVGIASDSDISSVSASSSELILDSNTEAGNAYIIMTSADANLGKSEEYLKQRKFARFIVPTFGTYVEKETYTIRTELVYPDIMIIGNESANKGRYSIIIKNEGFNSTTNQTMIKIDVT